MPIKLAFSTVACPDWTLEKVVEQAKAMGYDAVELRTLGPGGGQLASDPALTDPLKAAELFKSVGVEAACLSTSIALHDTDQTKARDAHWQAVQAIETAARIGCRAVRLFGYEVEAGQDRRQVIQRIAERARPLADKAGELGVELLFENAGGLSVAKDWWWLLEVLGHPMAGLCWNVANAAAAGESPAVSVPTLNSRIRIVKVKDTVIGAGSGFVPLGEGTVGIAQCVRRLLGQGFGGTISVEWDRLWLPSLAPAEEYLPDAHQRLKGWIDAAAQAMEDARPKAKAKPVAKAVAAT